MNTAIKRTLIPLVGLALALPGLAVAGVAHAAAPTPRIDKAHAEAIALKAAPGKIVESDYEKENGGWRWSFDIRQGTRIHEIGVDAMTGKIVESSYESAGEKD